MKSSIRLAAHGFVAFMASAFVNHADLNAIAAPPTPIWVKTVVDSLARNTVGPDVTVDANGNLHLGYYVDSGNQFQVRHALSTSAGWAIQPIITEDEEEQGDRVRIQVDSQGRPHLVYHVFDNGSNGTIKHAVLNNGGWQVSAAHRATIHGRLPDLSIDSYDVPHVSIHDNGGEGYGSYHSVLGPGGWAVESIGPPPSPGSSGTLMSAIEVDAGGNVHAAGFRSSPLVYATNGSGAWGFESVASFPSDTVDLELDSAGNPYLAWVDLDADTVRLAWNVGGQWLHDTVDVDASRAQVSLALDSHDRPRLSYFVQEGDHRFLRVGIKTVTGWDHYDIEEYPHLGSGNNYASIAIGPNDSTLLAYGHETRGLLLATLVPEPSSICITLTSGAFFLRAPRRGSPVRM